MKVKELIILVNERGEDIYRLSEEEGFSRGTLRQRLIGLGYLYDKDTGKWYFGETDVAEPLDKELSYRSRRKHPFTMDKNNPTVLKESTNLFQAMIQLTLSSDIVTFSFKTDKVLVERMKTFIKQVSLPSGRVYSLAVYEFLEKYEPIIEELKNNKN